MQCRTLASSEADKLCSSPQKGDVRTINQILQSMNLATLLCATLIKSSFAFPVSVTVHMLRKGTQSYSPSLALS